MPEAIPQTPTIGAYKGQPWILFDTVAAASFLLGDNTAGNGAIGTNGAAISAAGEMVFFNAPGRSEANFPWLTNMDQNGVLAYGFEVWAIAIEVKVPLAAIGATDVEDDDQAGIPQMQKLVEALLQYSVFELKLGQEIQTMFPATAFGNGGALWNVGGTTQNSQPEISCSLKLPEPIAMGRTQTVSAKLKIAPFMFPLIGTVAAPGVGSPAYDYSFSPDGAQSPVDLTNSPFGVQVKLIGRRIKDTQYGASPT